ncbi:hypothetical protein HY224_00155 [Candidatus Uhrbacteria bacterium]|nr:hypothetical protein [Candidatus Uhrbacteria bacterium]
MLDKYMGLEKEIKVYEQKKEQLLRENKGKFVLIKGEKIESIYTSYEDALAEGYKKFGNQEFLVKEITENENINFLTRSTEEIWHI